MIRLVRAELRKTTTTRLAWGMPLAQFLLAAVFAAGIAAFLLFFEVPGPDGASASAAEQMDDGVLARMVYTAALQFGYLLALVLGILAMGSEYRHKTLTATFLAEPRRSRVIGAKVVALSLVVLANGLAHLAGALLGGGAMLLLAGEPVFPDAAALAGVLLRLLLVLVLWGLMGLGLGVLIPNQVAALFVGVSLAFLIEPLLSVLISFVDVLADAARFFPSMASTSAVSAFDGVDDMTAQTMGAPADPLTWWAGALTLLAYAAVMTAIGWVLTRRRDVS